MVKPDWWDDNRLYPWLRQQLRSNFISKLTIKKEEVLLDELKNNIIVEEIIKSRNLKSCWLYQTPVWLYPVRIYVKHTLLCKILEENKVMPYRIENNNGVKLVFYALTGL